MVESPVTNAAAAWCFQVLWSGWPRRPPQTHPGSQTWLFSFWAAKFRPWTFYREFLQSASVTKDVISSQAFSEQEWKDARDDSFIIGSGRLAVFHPPTRSDWRRRARGAVLWCSGPLGAALHRFFKVWSRQRTQGNPHVALKQTLTALYNFPLSDSKEQNKTD